MVLQYAHEEQAPRSVEVLRAARDGATLRPEGDSFSLPSQVVDGYLKTWQVSGGLCIIKSQMSFAGDTVFREEYPERNALLLGFCLEGNCEWDYREKGHGRYELSPTECSLQCGSVRRCESRYAAGETYRSLSILLDPNRFPDLTFLLEAAHLFHADHRICTRIFASTPRLRLILRQLAQCPPEQALKRIYLEGKALELLSVFCSELIGKKEGDSGISKGDYESLKQARAFIDGHFLHPLTIAQIAKICYLSETKLKKGFKTCFGSTIYEYIVEQRMALAYKLLQSGQYKVKDVVWMAGYTNASHFIEAFRKQYGLTPGEV